MAPERAILADSNPDLIHFYSVLREDHAGLANEAGRWETDEETFYRVRELDAAKLSDLTRAARTLYLNRTCFNGLYRVNARGEFNVPYGRYVNPRVLDKDALQAASRALVNAKLLCADYAVVLQLAKRGDFVFLDPPYMPISRNADFKRYTKKQFREEDHERLAGEVRRLSSVGASVLLTNSNADRIHALYAGFSVEVVDTRRNINCDGQRRFGEDVIIKVAPAPITILPTVLDPQVQRYPSTRFMGSKEKLLGNIWRVASDLPGTTVLDLFSGTGCVGYMFKCQGKSVVTNDYMAFPHVFAKAMIENDSARLTADDIEYLTHGKAVDRFVRQTFGDLYFSTTDNLFLDLVRSRIMELNDAYKIALARAALIRACLKKRARGIFTYTGPRYDDGRRDMQLSMRQHFREAAGSVNDAVFSNGQKHLALRSDAMLVTEPADIVYVDPPYFSRLSDNDYVRRYHFVEGLAQDWKDVAIQEHTKTKKFKTYGSPFSTLQGTIDGFRTIFRRYADSSILVSYSSNSLPDKDAILALMREVKRDIEVVKVDHRYSFGNQGHKIRNANNKVEEYIFVAK